MRVSDLGPWPTSTLGPCPRRCRLTDMDIRADWTQHPDRPVLLIDETREDGTPQYVVFTALAMNARAVLAVEAGVATARSRLAPQSKDAVFKGSRLFGSRSKNLHEPIRRAAFEAITTADAVYLMMTDSSNVGDSYATNKGQSIAVTSAEPSRNIMGRER